ncbi:MAG: AbrB/MazE/SpoVT family DNA-binding domain-containing protein [Desulfotomaculaceae bacterium]
METRISSKGQITLPVAVRQKLRMKTGDILKIRVTEDGSILLSNNTVQKKSRTQALQILKDTAGAWKEMQETGEEYVRKLRKEDDDRWKVLDIE